MEARFDGSTVRAGKNARERYYDSRGYGRPRGEDLELAPVEAAHLLFRDDLSAVVDDRPGFDGSRLGFQDFLATSVVSEVSFFVYKELRERGFYLSPTADPDGIPSTVGSGNRTFTVYPRGKGPWDDEVAYSVWAVSEREEVPVSAIGDLRRVGKPAAGDSSSPDPQGVLAVVDEESEVTYLGVSEPTLTGSSRTELPSFEGNLLFDRCVVPDPPTELYERAFYGQRLDRDRAPVQLSLVEAAHLAADGTLTLADDQTESAYDRVLDRGRDVEGERFDRRLAVYRSLREAGVVPKTGFKFGADFRTYADVTSVSDLGHSEFLVRVLPDDHAFSPRDLSLDVRLAHGVRKTIAFGVVEESSIEWIAVERLTP